MDYKSFLNKMIKEAHLHDGDITQDWIDNYFSQNQAQMNFEEDLRTLEEEFRFNVNVHLSRKLNT